MENNLKVGDKVKVNALYFQETDYGDSGPKKDEILTLLKIHKDSSFQNCTVSFVTTDSGYIYDKEGPVWYVNSTHLDLVKSGNLLGTKNSIEKPDVTMIPYIALEEISKTLMFGETKHGRNNYKKGLPYSKFIGSAMRHLGKYNDGIDTDEESGENHIAHCAANLLMLLWTINNKPEMDDRDK